MERHLTRNEFGLWLLRVSRLWRREANAAVEEFGLSEATTLPLVQLGRLGGGVRQMELAAALGIEGPSLVPQLDALEKAKLVIRKPDPTDRRAKTLFLTARGEALLKKLEPHLADIRARLLAEVSEEDLATCFEVMGKIQAAAQALHQEKAQRSRE
ncbi:MarR family transcriptional regulator [Parvibaculum sedimenti]|uniref:MarR family transcriptional regulator n=1 Tax=Parvibaculum sedimenti TaxID=2608632 RepID=A0A6N6VEG6_9HYPH|nr:MarR family transcriptional regulator [Parvibaculum sedimenti]KAB7738629.1 MarR family transcriptional regulator [Parvibaculum sedimenti]